MITFNWIKKGLILNNAPKLEWAQSHYQFCAVLQLDDCVRIFYTTRPKPEKDNKYTTYIRYVDVDENNFQKVIRYGDKPVIPLGDYGCFDEFGTMPGDFIFIDGKVYMYYTGWQRLSSIPYTFSVGLAISKDNGRTFKKYSKGPIIGQTVDSPLTVGSCTVFEENGIKDCNCRSD